MFVLLYLLHTGPRFFSLLFTEERFAVQVCSFSGGALLHDHIYLYLGAAVLKSCFDTALKVLLPRGDWVSFSKGFCSVLRVLLN